MSKSDRPSASKSLTPVELEMMNIIWSVGPCTVAQVREQLGEGRDLAYTSVSTIVRILEQKGFVTSERVGRGHVYSASISKDQYQTAALDLLVRDVFNGTPSLVVQRLVDGRSLTAKELEKIWALLKRNGR